MRGVYPRDGKFRAMIRVAGRLVSLGEFANETDAGLAFDFAVYHLGLNRRLNCPDRSTPFWIEQEVIQRLRLVTADI